MNNKFLYGAAVQGIQQFIFQTNKLREIAGASELVEQICTLQFAKALGYMTEDQLKVDKNAMLTAAGNIKYVFESEEVCRKVVRDFPKQIMEFAPGITVSQAVVEIGEKDKIQDRINELESKLRAQRNKAFRPYDIGLIAVNRSRRTGLPAYHAEKKEEEIEYVDKGNFEKIKTFKNSFRLPNALFGSYDKNKLPWEMDEITHSKSKDYSWLAIVHADGNNMGMLLQKLAKEFNDLSNEEYVEKFKKFSLTIDNSTTTAANYAYAEVMKNVDLQDDQKLPFRPIVIGGDDLTIICRADLAIEFTKIFLKKFHKNTETNFAELKAKCLEKGITACAGIAYIKESYPFHYGYHLAEKLTERAKNIAKTEFKEDELTPACLMFHKVRDSFVEEYNDIIARELTTRDATIRFNFGPYFLEAANGFSSIDHLINHVKEFEGKEGNAIKSHLRQWLTDLHHDTGLAELKIQRLISVGNKSKLEKLGFKEDNHYSFCRDVPDGDKTYKTIPVYDWLTIDSIN